MPFTGILVYHQLRLLAIDMAPSAPSCKACGRYAKIAESVKCTKCPSHYHRACVNVTKDAKVSPVWQCPECKAQTPRKDNTEVPVLGADASLVVLENSPVASEGLCMKILQEVRQ